MSDKLHLINAISSHGRNNLLKHDECLAQALSNSTANGLPSIAISDLQGQYLAIQCRLIGAKNVLEIGTLGGYSTIWFAKTGAHVTSIEIEPKHRDVALRNIKAAGYEDSVEVILGAALDVLPNLSKQGKVFDFVFVDASWDEQWQYFDWAVKVTRKGGCIYVDNVVRELLENGQAGLREGQQTLITKIGEDSRVTATLTTVVSDHKGNAADMMDGFVLAIVN